MLFLMYVVPVVMGEAKKSQLSFPATNLQPARTDSLQITNPVSTPIP